MHLSPATWTTATLSVWSRDTTMSVVKSPMRLLHSGYSGFNSSDQRSVWRMLNHVLHRSPPRCLPEFLSIGQLARMFGSFFKDKLKALRTAFPNGPMSDDTLSPDILVTPTLATFYPVALLSTNGGLCGQYQG